jgi:hypothetical protein
MLADLSTPGRATWKETYMTTRKREYWELLKRKEDGYYKKGEETITSSLGAIDCFIVVAIVLGVEVLLAVARAAQ